jgi:hypothetical protein
VARSPQPSGIPWRDKPYQTISDASALIGGSNSRTYALLAEGALEAVRLAGKTLVRTASLIAFLEQGAEGWRPDRKRVEKAVAGRPEVARKRANIGAVLNESLALPAEDTIAAGARRKRRGAIAAPSS